MAEHESENLERFSFTIPRNLIDQVDHLIEKTGKNRSMAVREALTHYVDHEIQKQDDLEGSGVATISYVYDHHDTRVLSDIMETQHNFEDLIQTTSHIHIDHSNCFEISICKGDISQIRVLGDDIREIKGIHSFFLNYAKTERKE